MKQIDEQPRTVGAAPNLGDVVVLVATIAALLYFVIDTLVGVLP